MATFKTINQKGKYHDLDSKSDVINYILNPEKTHSKLYGYELVDPMDPAESMQEVSNKFNKVKGIQIRHYVISFLPYEVSDPHIAHKIAEHIAMYIGYEYQTVYAVHENTDQIHIHIAHNSVSHVDGHRFHGSKTEYYNLLNIVYHVLKQYGIKRLIPVSSHE